MKYHFQKIENKWQDFWQQNETFKTPNPSDAGFDSSKPKYYVLDMFPYPSGVGLHVGHPLGYIATDIVARYKRMRGYNVMHPMGFDAFGLPAEQFAVERGVHPAITTDQNIKNMIRQLKRLGLSYDWSRQVSTTDVKYYRWTQWIFTKLYNSWFDPTANQARPISELIQQLEAEQYYVSISGNLIAPDAEGLDAVEGRPIGSCKWFELDDAQQQGFLGNYRLAYLDEAPVNWCPALGTVLANEEVTNEGKSERGNHPVYKKQMKQWMLRITAYAERLADDLKLVDWPESTKIMQRNWIGRSEGAMVDFDVELTNDVIQVYTTRPDTLFGATYMVLAPEHSLVNVITTADQRAAIEAYQKQTASRSDVDRMVESKEKTGVFTGAHATNPANGEKIPVWIADYVLWGYGTGAIMAVPAHDQRDCEFAKQFALPIKAVVQPGIDWLNETLKKAGQAVCESAEQAADLMERYLNDPADFPACFSGHAVGVNSENDEFTLNELPTADAQKRITQWLEEKGIGHAQVQYKLRDWLFSRQRYWGEPFPILHGPNGQMTTVDDKDLPVALPPMDDFNPVTSNDPAAPPMPPLAKAAKEWREVEIDGQIWKRELNTMPQWAGSCWYYLRFIDPNNDEQFASNQAEQYWMKPSGQVGTPKCGGIDLYVGGVEHAVLHLLYARFWHKVLFDLGKVSTPEPFGRLFNQGYIQAYAYTDQRGVYVPAEQVTEKEGKYYYKDQEVNREFGKMGKSLKNAIAPDDICEEYGCDTMRLYEMYMGPLDQSKIWNTRDILGVHRFLQRLWRNFINQDTAELKIDDALPSDSLARQLHRTIKRVTDSMDRLSINTSIAALIELNNELVALDRIPRQVAETMVKLLSPLAPHIAEELWQQLGNNQSLVNEAWPTYDPAMLIDAQVELPVQVNGKLKCCITVASDASDQAIEQAAKANKKVLEAIGRATVRKIIIIKGKMVNIVAK